MERKIRRAHPAGGGDLLIFSETKLAGVWMIEPERISDERGFFARTWCADEFARHGLRSTLQQCSISFNARKATVRGLHFQRAPHEEAKTVRCSAGAIFDVAVDLRRDSRTYLQWVGVELSAERRNILYIPEGCAHGFQTLEENTQVEYQMSTAYQPASSVGVRWDDPKIRVRWPLEISVIAARDQQFPDLP